MKRQLYITDFYTVVNNNTRVLLQIHRIFKKVQNKIKWILFKKQALSQSLITDYFPTVITPFSKTQNKITNYFTPFYISNADFIYLKNILS
jgi:hypothetical protein